ncbi:MAG: hypothetical protein AB7J13_10300, partial [Pyrinomonadaceae bacterium]
MRHRAAGTGSISRYGIDTAFVLFFLAMEYGRAVRLFAIDGILMAITMAMVLVLPYFLPSNWNGPTFTNWLAARTSVALTGMVFGAVFSYSLGAVLPVTLKSAPMTFLILAAMISCYVQYYGLMRL